MKKSVVLAALLVLAAASSHADLIPDPVELGLLGQILAAIEKADAWLRDIDDAVFATKEHLNEVWPGRAFEEISYVFGEARTIRQEIDGLACGWSFSLRARKLWDGLFRGVSFCKPEFRLVYGAPPSYYAQDLDEAYDWASTLTTAQVSDWVATADEDEADARWLIREARRGRDASDPNSPYGPGYSQRLSAVAAARLAEELHRAGDMEAADLRETLLRSNSARFRARKEIDLAVASYALVAGQPPFADGPPAGGAE